eukprot:gene11321-17661_t
MCNQKPPCPVVEPATESGKCGTNGFYPYFCCKASPPSFGLLALPLPTPPSPYPALKLRKSQSKDDSDVVETAHGVCNGQLPNTTLEEEWRNIENYNAEYERPFWGQDFDLGRNGHFDEVDHGWVKFVGVGGDALPLTPPGAQHCGTYAAGWLSGCSGQDAHCSQPGKYPAVDHGIVEATACFDLDKTSYNPCQYSVKIEMVNCGPAKGMLWKLAPFPYMTGGYLGAYCTTSSVTTFKLVLKGARSQTDDAPGLIKIAKDTGVIEGFFDQAKVYAFGVWAKDKGGQIALVQNMTFAVDEAMVTTTTTSPTVATTTTTVGPTPTVVETRTTTTTAATVTTANNKCTSSCGGQYFAPCGNQCDATATPTVTAKAATSATSASATSTPTANDGTTSATHDSLTTTAGNTNTSGDVGVAAGTMHKVSPGKVAGIVIGALVGVAILVGIGGFAYRHATGTLASKYANMDTTGSASIRRDVHQNPHYADPAGVEDSTTI